jgi:hypothetical protein
MNDALSRMLGVLLLKDGTGAVFGVFPDGRFDRIDGTIAELTPLALEILAGKYSVRANEKRPPGATLH